jgi:small subunit ribosomal protein S12
MSPKKPNSANRRIIRARLTQYTLHYVVKIPGEKHSLQQHSNVLINGAKVKDLIGVSTTAIRGKLDLAGVVNRKTARSVYGVKIKAV